MGWHGSRGFLLGLGALFPLPRSFDLLVTLDWIAVSGLGLGIAIEADGRSLASALVLDPVDDGLASGWVAGSLVAGSGRQHAGLVLDTPVTGSVPRGDMDSIAGASSRLALQSLEVRLEPLAHVSLLGGASAARSLVPLMTWDGWTDLAPAGTWARMPAVALSLLPTRILGRKLPVLLGGEVRHVQLVPLGPTPGSRLEASGVDLTLTGRWLPGRIVDLGVHASWHGALLRHAEDLEPALWLQTAAAGAAATLSLMGPVSPAGLAHRIDLSASYRGAITGSTAQWNGPARPFVPAAFPSHLGGLVLRNALVRVRGELLSLSTGAWIAPAAGRRPLVIVSAGLDASLGPLHLGTLVDLPSDGWRPSLVRSRLSLAGAGLSIDLEHLFVSRPEATTLDVSAWMAGRLGVGRPPARAKGLHIAVLGLSVPLAAGLMLGGRAGADLASGSPAWLEGEVSWSHPCECLTLKLTVIQRASVPAPDILLSIGM
jgi:hypothetical protein